MRELGSGHRLRQQTTVAPPARVDAHASPSVVYLDIVRAKREFSALENQVRRLRRHTSVLVDRNRYEANVLYHLLQAAQEVRLRSRELLERSRSQTHARDWWLTGPAAQLEGAAGSRATSI